MQTPPNRKASRSVPLVASLVLAAVALALGPLASSAMDANHADHHAHHHHDDASRGEGYVRSQATYALPDVQLVDADGKRVPLRGALAATEPVILNFIFTTCGAVCPVMSATFSELQTALADRADVRLLSISIDPEEDTPAALKAYADRYGAGPQWRMLTGTLADSIAVQRAFGVYRGDKMNHAPATFLRAAPDQPWVKLDGFGSAADIVRELQRLQTN